MCKNILRIGLVLALSLPLMGCSNTKNQIDYDFKINDTEYVLNEDGNGFEEIKVSSGDKIIVTLPCGEPRFEWLIHPSIDYMDTIKKEIVELYDYDEVEGVSNLADQFIFEIKDDSPIVLEFKKINKNYTENFNEDDYQNLSEEDYNDMESESLIIIKITSK